MDGQLLFVEPMANLQPEPLHLFPAIATSEPEAARYLLGEIYGAVGFDVAEPLSLRLRANYTILHGVGIGFCEYGTRAAVEFPEGSFARLQMALSGKAATAASGTLTEIGDRRVCVTSAHRPNRIEFGHDYKQLIVRVSTDALKQKMTSLFGVEPKSVPEFNAGVDFDHAPLGTLLNQIRFVCDQLKTSAGRPHDLMLREWEAAIVTGFLTSLPHSMQHSFEPQPTNLSDQQVRRVEEYIDAHWAEPVTVDVLARMTGIGSRSIFYAFKSRRGYTPLAYLKSVRLGQARKHLLDVERDESVSAIAFRCGFSNLGQFARDYRARFGELPSATRKRTRHG